MERLIFFLSLLSCNYKYTVERDQNMVINGNELHKSHFTHNHQELDQVSNNNSIINRSLNNQSMIYNFQRRFNESIIIVQGSFWFVITKIKEGFFILKNKIFAMNNDDSETIYSEDNIDQINNDLEHKVESNVIFFEDKDAHFYQSMSKMAMPQMVDGLGELFAELEKPNSTIVNSITQRAITSNNKKNQKNVSFKSPHAEDIKIIEMKPLDILDNKLTYTENLPKKIILDNTEYVSSSSEENNDESSFQDSSSSDNQEVKPTFKEEFKEEFKQKTKENQSNIETLNIHNKKDDLIPDDIHQSENSIEISQIYSPFKKKPKKGSYKLKKNLSIDCGTNKTISNMNQIAAKNKPTIESYPIQIAQNPQKKLEDFNFHHNHLTAAHINILTYHNSYENPINGHESSTPNPEDYKTNPNQMMETPGENIQRPLPINYKMQDTSLSSFHSSAYKKDLHIKIPLLNLHNLIDDNDFDGKNTIDFQYQNDNKTVYLQTG